ncbi:hypothetical protein ERJ75_000797200 [Trypanosoma vivax]|nr:hypothetical protein ERJ75_000797200 [Trypanosoma vivax]
MAQIGTGSTEKHAPEGMQRTGTTAMVYARKVGSKGHATALAEALAAFDSQWTTSTAKRQRRRQRSTCPLAKAAARTRQDTRSKITFAGMFTAKTAAASHCFSRAARDRARRRPGLDYKLTHSPLSQTPNSNRGNSCACQAPHRQAHHRPTALAKAAAAIYDELQAREAAANARRNTPKEQGKGEQHATASPSSTKEKRKKEAARRAARRRKNKQARRTAAQTRVKHVPGTPCSQRAQQQHGNAHIAHSGHKKQRTRGTKM